jgi:hypothetical protein
MANAEITNISDLQKHYHQSAGTFAEFSMLLLTHPENPAQKVVKMEQMKYDHPELKNAFTNLELVYAAKNINGNIDTTDFKIMAHVAENILHQIVEIGPESIPSNAKQYLNDAEANAYLDR